MNLTCGSGKIRVIKANYGRTQKYVHFNNNASSNVNDCFNENQTLGILLEHCENQSSCQFTVNNTFFHDDPCPKTNKYLNVTYNCDGR